MKKTALLIACAGLVIGGIGLAAPETASAGIRFSFGSHSGHRDYRGGGYSSHRNYDYGRNYGHYGHGSQWSGRSYNRGHYDYHPTTITPHGNHFHVTPGHYDYHRGGHGYNH